MIAIRCHLCRERFPWDITKGYPTHCERCGEFIGIPDDAPELATPYISTPKKRGMADQVYRDMEAKSEVRAQLAAAESGLTMADVSHLKMTNMKDGQREGDVAFSENIPATNQVQQAMQHAAPGTVGFGNNAAAIAASAGTRQGPLPNAGTNYIHNKLRPAHGATGAPTSFMPGKGTRT